MGQKIHPKSVRLGYIQDWDSRWFSPREMPALIGEDFRIRQLIKERFRMGAVSWVAIERAGTYLRVNIHTARPGVVIGKKGADIEYLRTAVETMTGRKTYVNVMEIKDPELDARLVGEAIAMQIEKRVAYRRAIRRAIERSMAAGALGVKVKVGGRLGGSEIARREWYREGRVPLHTFCADIDYGLTEARTNLGIIGVKVWIFKKEHFAKAPRDLLAEVRALREEAVKPVLTEKVPAKTSATAEAPKEGTGQVPAPEGELSKEKGDADA